jgi:hypothetical protein
MELNIPAPKGIDSKTWENFQKIFNNEMDWYEKHPPFESYTNKPWRLFFSMFHGFAIVRRLMGGTWVRGELGLWMRTTEHFPKEWLAKHPHETWN